MSVRDLYALGHTIAGAYPYAAWVGRHLAARRPDWYERFERACPDAASLPLPQARDYAFLVFCEDQPAWRGRVVELADEFLASCEDPRFAAELDNTVGWYAHLTQLDEPDQRPSRGGEASTA